MDCSVRIHQALGPGLLETAYQQILLIELQDAGLNIEAEKPVPVVWKSRQIENVFRYDILVEGRLLLELKSQERINPVHKKQLLTYLKLMDLRLGLLLNFGAFLMKDGIFRVVNKLEEPKKDPRSLS